MPLLHLSLRATCPDVVPQPILERLQVYFFANAAQSLFLTEELLTLLQRLEALAITAVPLKGLVLAASAYGHIALQQFGDLDILLGLLPANDLLGHALAPRDRASAPDRSLGHGGRRTGVCAVVP